MFMLFVIQDQVILNLNILGRKHGTEGNFDNECASPSKTGERRLCDQLIPNSLIFTPSPSKLWTTSPLHQKRQIYKKNAKLNDTTSMRIGSLDQTLRCLEEEKKTVTTTTMFSSKSLRFALLQTKLGYALYFNQLTGFDPLLENVSPTCVLQIKR